ncbi:MAG TPA: mechanosensitive ion channel domain-containing protein [Methanoregula sp.]|nr:mechanosensitive ion channel domain-containing protein [Methanoregula sp.]
MQMRTRVLPLRYFFLLFIVIVAMMGAMVLADLISTNSQSLPITLLVQTPFANTVLEKIFGSLCIAIIILVMYTIGIYLIVRRIPDEASRFTAVRIFSVLLIALGLLLGMLEWVGEPAQIVLILGILWGAIVVALRDVIQNMVGSLLVLVSRVFRIGDRIEIRGKYGVVMDIGAFRTTMMTLDKESGDHPSGNITTIPNGILFREMITNSSRQFSFTEDEIRITLPFSSDIEKIRTIIIAIVRDHTRDISEKAAREIENASDKKYLPAITTEPTVFIHIDYGQILMVVKYYSDMNRRSEIKNGIVTAISRQIPGVIDTGR